MGSFGGAFLLPYLTPKQAALMAIGALLFNMFVLPKLMPSIVRREGNSGYLEILMYPAAVLATILAFMPSTPPAGIIHALIIWGCLAIGDGVIGICHGAFKGKRPLRWNERKSLKGVVFSAILLAGICSPIVLMPILRNGILNNIGMAVPAVLVAFVELFVCFFLFALLESWWFGIVDNLFLPLSVGLFFGAFWPYSSYLYYTEYKGEPFPYDIHPWIALLISSLFALGAWASKKATLRGAVVGFVIACIAMLTEPWIFIFILGFFIVGVLATKYKHASKELAGISEARGGRRDAAEVFGALGVMAWLIPLAMPMFRSTVTPTDLSVGLLIVISPLIAKTMDTVSSEMGKAIGGTTISLRTLKVVPPGTDGGVSLAGTIWGLAGAALLAMLILPLHWGGWKEVGLLVAFAVAANLFESYWAFWAGPRGVDDGPHTNFMMTLFAATLAWFWWM